MVHIKQIRFFRSQRSLGNEFFAAHQQTWRYVHIVWGSCSQLVDPPSAPPKEQLDITSVLAANEQLSSSPLTRTFKPYIKHLPGHFHVSMTSSGCFSGHAYILNEDMLPTLASFETNFEDPKHLQDTWQLQSGRPVLPDCFPWPCKPVDNQAIPDAQKKSWCIKTKCNS